MFEEMQKAVLVFQQERLAADESFNREMTRYPCEVCGEICRIENTVTPTMIFCIHRAAKLRKLRKLRVAPPGPVWPYTFLGYPVIVE